jgi:hypothetical protein
LSGLWPMNKIPEMILEQENIFALYTHFDQRVKQ